MATDTAIDVVMPQMGVSVSEGTITKWLKNEGEEIAADESLLEISTDKVDTEVPSPGSGVVLQILVQEGETVDVGTKLAVIGPAGSRLPRRLPRSRAGGTGRAEPEPEPLEPAPAPQAPRPPRRRRRPARADRRRGGRQDFVSPVVARIASEHGVDVSAVPGTGRGGRVTKKDILGYIEGGAPAAPAAPPKRPRLPLRRAAEAPALPLPAAAPAAPVAASRASHSSR